MPKTVTTSNHYHLLSDEDNLIMTGPDGQQGYGNALDNRIDGSNANNLLSGMQGADIMAGHGGNDTYFVDNVGDQVIEDANEGIDSVFSTVNYTLTKNVENLALFADPNSYGLTSGPEKGTGNELGNKIWGNSANNTLDGKDGNDFLYGFNGDDKLIGGNGQDVLNGDAGNDTLLGGNDSDWLWGGQGKDVLTGGSGFDYFQFVAEDGKTGQDIITDFHASGPCKPAEDQIRLYGYGTAANGAHLEQVGHTDVYKIIAGSDAHAGIASGQSIEVDNVFHLAAGQDYLFF